MVASSVVLTVVVLNYHHRTAETHVMPMWVSIAGRILHFGPGSLRVQRMVAFARNVGHCLHILSFFCLLFFTHFGDTQDAVFWYIQLSFYSTRWVMQKKIGKWLIDSTINFCFPASIRSRLPGPTLVSGLLIPTSFFRLEVFFFSGFPGFWEWIDRGRK